jgi:predicted AAA+ superfamily ATPase
MVKREHYLEKLRQLRDMNVIKIVTGVRRSGKSTLLEQFRHELKESGVADKNIIAYNLEEKENQKFTRNPDLLHDTILRQIEKNAQNYVFIDEVQAVPEFEKMVDSLFVKDDIDLYITGSNAYMTSSEIATLLSGRYVEIKMQPLTFSEFLQFFPEPHDKTAKFQQFMKYGGFPEVANFLVAGAEAQIPLYLTNIYETVLAKDIKTHKQIRSAEDFRNTVLYIYDNIGSITSPNNIANALRIENKLINKETVDNYLTAMQDCFVLYCCRRFDIRGKKMLRTLEKYYAVDLGLVDTILGRPSNANLGHRLENVVYLELLKRYGQVWVGKNYDKEIDFVVKNSSGITEYFQVALSAIEPSTLEREINAFKNTGDRYKRTLLTMDSFETDEQGVGRANVIDWLTGK